MQYIGHVYIPFMAFLSVSNKRDDLLILTKVKDFDPTTHSSTYTSFERKKGFDSFSLSHTNF